VINFFAFRRKKKMQVAVEGLIKIHLPSCDDS
jgi:hypothetical protein